MFTDSHAHLEGKRFDADRDEVLARAKQSGIDTYLAIGNGEGPDTADCGIRLAEKYNGNPEYPEIWTSVGIHPHEAHLANDAAYSQLAVAAKLPIIIHNRPSDNTDNAWDDFFRLVTEHWTPTGMGGILHCFTGTVEHARRGLDLGFMISFAGNITFPKAQNIRDAAQIVPLDRMLIETDSPYLAPIPHRGKRNEPSFVTEVARQIGQLRGMSAEAIGEQTSENFRKFFRLADKTR